MVVPSRTGLSAAVAAAVVLSAPVLLGGGLKAEERINWLKTPAAVRSLQAPPPLPSPPNLPPQTYRYRLAPGDRLVTSVFKIEGYEAEVQVLSDGTINLPRLGTVVVWGLTLEEARQRITAGYSRFLRRPLVYLDLVEQRPVRVTVTGEVLRPGIFTLPVSSQGVLKIGERCHQRGPRWRGLAHLGGCGPKSWRNFSDRGSGPVGVAAAVPHPW